MFSFDATVIQHLPSQRNKNFALDKKYPLHHFRAMRKPIKKAEGWMKSSKAVDLIKKHSDDIGLPVNLLLMRAGVYSATYCRWAAGSSEMARAELVNKILAVRA